MTEIRRRVGVLAAGAATVALVASPLAAVADNHEGAMVSEACQAANIDDLLKNPGRLTLSTDNPSFGPWWGGDPSVDPDSGWEFSYPPSGEGLEGGVAYAIANALGFEDDQVDWIQNTEFSLAFAPGPKPFDFHMAQIFIDKELNVPIRYAAYDFPIQAGGPLQVIEEYTYLNLKLNVGLTDKDFDHNNSDYSFH